MSLKIANLGRGRLLTSLIVALFLVGLALVPGHSSQISHANTVLTVTFIDVGQGDSILIQTPEGENVLVDGGDSPAVASLLALLQSKGVTRFKQVVLTHPHADHLAGINAVLQRMQVDSVVSNGDSYTTQGYRQFIQMLESKAIPTKVARAGDTLAWSPSISVSVVNPVDPLMSDADSVNNNSVALLVKYGKVAFFLAGDMQEEAETATLARGPPIKADVLKVGHHGSKYSSSNSFLATVRPSLAVISVGANNTYGHPTPEAIGRLLNSGASIKRTDLDGTITVTTDGYSYSVSTGSANSTVNPAPGKCQFVLGFQTIHDQIPNTVGDCVVDQHYNPDNGDALQETAGGMLVWRKADNFTAFTDGYRSWVNGPYGLQQRLNPERFDWENDTTLVAPSQPATATPSQPAVATGCHINGVLPDPQCTPGAVAETDANVVCHRTTDTVRPSTSYTNRLKVQQIILYGYIDTSMSAYEEDHLIPLELGGSPTDPANLWPEPYPSAYDKDKVENYLHAQVCAGKVTLADAQQEIATNWQSVFTQISASPSTAPSPESPVATSAPVPSSGGHRFAVSVQARSKYYCDTDPAWKTLSQANLRWYDSEASLKADYPNLTLNETCR